MINQELNQVLLDELIVHIKTVKYKNLIQDLKLELQCIEDCTNVHYNYILLRLIKIKPSQRCKGWGQAVLGDIIGFADHNNIKIQLYCTNIYGMDLLRLKALYKKHGFVEMNIDNDGRMIYFNRKIKI